MTRADADRLVEISENVTSIMAVLTSLLQIAAADDRGEQETVRHLRLVRDETR